MAIYTAAGIRLKVATDSGYSQILFKRDDEAYDVSRTDLATSTSGNASIAAGGSATLSLNDVDTIKMVYIEVDQSVEITIKKGATYYVGNATNGLVVTPKAALSRAIFFAELVTGADPDGIIVKNLSATTACNCSYIIAGTDN